MRDSPLLGAGIVGVLGLVGLLSLPVSSPGQTAKPAVKPLAPPCNTLSDLVSTPAGAPVQLTPVDETTKESWDRACRVPRA
jgi:hypothetical protein